MKKTTTSNPLKFFNDAKEARNKSFKKALRKAQDGTEMTAQDIMDAKTQNTYNQINSLKDSQAANKQQIVDSSNEFKNNLSKAFPKTFGQ